LKKKINRFYSDIFDDKQLNLILPETRIFFSVRKDGQYSGSFIIKSRDSRRIRGMIYTSVSRMQCKETGFDSDLVKIQYTFNAGGLPAGDIVKGKFYIVSEAGEYEILFAASVETPYIETSMGKVTNLEEFTKLAAYNYREATALFASTRFRELLSQEHFEVIYLYEGIRKLSLEADALEEFLVGTGHKEQMKLYLGAGERTYTDPERSQRDVLEIAKRTWGYMAVTVETEGDFIRVDRDRFSTQDFTGNRFELEYSILRNRLHEGKNAGCIRLVTPYEDYTYDIIVRNIRITEEEFARRRERKLLAASLLQKYISYRTGEEVPDDWFHESIGILDRLGTDEDEHSFYPLIKANIYLESGVPDKAQALLEPYGKKHWTKNKEPELWGYYVYLQTLLKHDLSYSIKASDEIQKLYDKNEDSWILLWLLLQIQEYLIQNGERRLQVIADQWEDHGFHSLLYLEAYLTMCEQPSLIEPLTPFSIHVLVFAKRRGILTKEVAAGIALSISHQREFQPLLFEILEGCYKIQPTTEIVSAICRYLIMGHKTETEYFDWYEKGVIAGLHIARLYEFYMYSVNEDEGMALPQAIYLYFSHQNELNASKKAFLYSNLVRHMEKYPEIYENMKGQIEDFTRFQLRSRKITSNLRILYRHFLPQWDLDNEQKHALSDILYTYEIKASSSKIKQITVLNHDLLYSYTAPCFGGSAQVMIYSKKDHIILQDGKGKIYYRTMDYDITRMFPEDHYLQEFKEEYLGHVGIMLDMCASGEITEGNAEFYENLVKYDGLRESAKRNIKRELLFYFYKRDNVKGISHYLPEVDDATLGTKYRSYLVGIYLHLNQLKKAFETIRKFGYKELDMKYLLELCSRYIKEDYFKENDLLMDACFFCFDQDHYDSTILEYLVEYYCGRTENMKRIWTVAEQMEYNTHNLEERILTQMLFTEQVIGEEKIFYNYYIHGGNDKVKKAYLSYKSYGYFVKNQLLDSRFFEYIETEYAREEEINLSCKLASLKYYAGQKVEDPLTRRMLEEFMADCRTEGFFFSYFQQYDENLLRKFSLNNRIIVQYQGMERSKVTIFYAIHKADEHVSGYTEEIMPQTYHTYFLKEFLLFTGEILQYYIVEENEEGSRVVEVNMIKQEEEFAEFTGRFSAINRILKEKYPETMLEEYERRNYLVTQLFREM